MKPMTKGDWIATILGMVIIEMIFLWEIDISVSAMVLQATLGQEIIVSNGWIIGSPSFTYHVGLYGTIINLFLMACIGIHLLRIKE